MYACLPVSELSSKINMTEGADKDSSQSISHSTSLSGVPCGIISIVDSREIEDNDEISLGSVPRERSKTPPPVLHKENVDSTEINPGIPGSGNPMSAIASDGSDAVAKEVCSADGDSSRRHLKSSSLPHGVKLCPEAEVGKGESLSVDGSDEQQPEGDKWVALEAELRKAQSELKAKDAEVEKLKGIRQQVEGELTDLTAALFEEAHKMVQEAKMKEVTSEKNLREAKMQLDGLQAEVAALKTLLITSTPSRPNLSNGSNGISIFKKQHKRCPSHNHLQYGRSEDEPDGKGKSREKSNNSGIDRTICEVDPAFHGMFSRWREEPTLTVNHNNNRSNFLQQIYTEDINPCLTFQNEALVERLRQAVEENSIWVEPVPEKSRSDVPTECALVCCPRICHYRMRFSYDSEEWYNISRLCRDRIAAVCEFLNYLRYIKNGLVKASLDDAYWEVIRLRKQIALAKLGIPIEQT